MKRFGVIVLAISVAFILSQCNKNRIQRTLQTTSPDSVVVNNNTQTIIFAKQQLAAGSTRFGFPNLTNAIVDSGNVAAYFRKSDSTNWITLPYNDGVIDCHIQLPLAVGNMVLYTSETLVNYDFRFDLVSAH